MVVVGRFFTRTRFSISLHTVAFEQIFQYNSIPLRILPKHGQLIIRSPNDYCQVSIITKANDQLDGYEL